MQNSANPQNNLNLEHTLNTVTVFLIPLRRVPTRNRRANLGGGGEYSTLERLTPTKHGRLRRVILEVYATTAHSGVFPRSQQQLLGHGKIRYAMMARWPPR